MRNELITGTAKVRCFGDKVGLGRLTRFGHVLKKDDCYTGRMVLRME